MTDARDELIRRLPLVFRALPPNSDAELFPPGFGFAGAGPVELAELRGRDRFELATSAQWLDPDILHRMSGYARWYFAPTFLLLMLRHIDDYEFEGLLRVFAYSVEVVRQMGIDPSATVLAPSVVPAVDMARYIHGLSIDDCLPMTERRSTAMDVHHFAVAASHFNSVERKLVVQFLNWVKPKFPDDVGVDLARQTFWDRP